MEEADRIALELRLRGHIAFDRGEAADQVTLQAAMQRRARQLGWSAAGVKAVVERQRCVLSKADDHRLLIDRQHR